MEAHAQCFLCPWESKYVDVGAQVRREGVVLDMLVGVGNIQYIYIYTYIHAVVFYLNKDHSQINILTNPLPHPPPPNPQKSKPINTDKLFAFYVHTVVS